ncbi:recombinase family protein [Lysobacter enzymogenes]|nr:recombinase family protein [Lysobacter enzymogenes]QCW24462.1 recombinase family protein [Lysobacter enzymogenes]
MSDSETSRRLRCAVYTRKSTEEGLEREYNSIEAQRDAGQAFIASRRAEGWIPVADDYDDAGYSAATLARPALERLLDDIRAGKIDIVVTYKIDRLSRSLRDFHRLWEHMTAHGVEFVAVTQQFNTTDAMGRLMLNILLSFAEFDRELDVERARDKMIASKKKGLWMHGVPPLGYDLRNRRLVADPKEAPLVRWIFQQVAAGVPTSKLVAALRDRGATSKVWTTRNGRQIVGKAIDKSLLYKMLANRTYLGELRHGAQWFPDSHEAIIDPELWAEAQAATATRQRALPSPDTSKIPFPLRGLVFAADGRAMTPWHTTKRNGRTYRYYVHTRALHESAKLLKLPRVPAGELEAAIIEQLRSVLRAPELISAMLPQAVALDASLDEPQIMVAMLRLHEIWEYLAGHEQALMLQLLIERIVVHEDRAELRLRPLGLTTFVHELEQHEAIEVSA